MSGSSEKIKSINPCADEISRAPSTCFNHTASDCQRMKERESDILTRGSITTLDPTYLTSPSDLTDIDLSILALRPDLPILTRQRCYALFSTRKLVYDSLEKDCKPPETSLSLVQWDLASYVEHLSSRLQAPNFID